MHSKVQAGWFAAMQRCLSIAAALFANAAPALTQAVLPGEAAAAEVRSGPPPAPPGGPAGPPPAAYSACEGKREEAACRVSFPDREIQGTCVYAPDDKLFCLPEEPLPPPPSRTPNVL